MSDDDLACRHAADRGGPSLPTLFRRPPRSRARAPEDRPPTNHEDPNFTHFDGVHMNGVATQTNKASSPEPERYYICCHTAPGKMPGGYGGVNNFPSTAEDVPSWLQAIGLVRRTPSTRVRAALAGPGRPGWPQLASLGCLVCCD